MTSEEKNAKQKQLPVSHLRSIPLFVTGIGLPLKFKGSITNLTCRPQAMVSSSLLRRKSSTSGTRVFDRPSITSVADVVNDLAFFSPFTTFDLETFVFDLGRPLPLLLESSTTVFVVDSSTIGNSVTIAFFCDVVALDFFKGSQGSGRSTAFNREAISSMPTCNL